MQRGLTTVEGIVVIVVVLVLGTLVLIVAQGRCPIYERTKTECMNNMRNLVGLLDMAPYPEQGGADLILYLVAKGDIAGADQLEILFCPGDQRESLAKAGGAARYEKLELGKPNGHLTSYAGRDLRDPRFALAPVDRTRSRWSRGGAVVLIADDSADHHDGEGIVVGLTGGHAYWRDKADFYELEGELVVGPKSRVEELRCLKVD